MQFRNSVKCKAEDDTANKISDSSFVASSQTLERKVKPAIKDKRREFVQKE